jgi:prepilin-type N-terminal cleavage/methylation domain-containing protein
MLSRTRRDEGWTLFELMAVVLILSILIAIAVASYSLTNERARRVACQENLRSLNTAVLLYEGQTGHRPADIGDLAPYTTKSNYTTCPGGPTYSYDATATLVRCPIHPAQ